MQGRGQRAGADHAAGPSGNSRVASPASWRTPVFDPMNYSPHPWPSPRPRRLPDSVLATGRDHATARQERALHHLRRPSGQHARVLRRHDLQDAEYRQVGAGGDALRTRLLPGHSLRPVAHVLHVQPLQGPWTGEPGATLQGERLLQRARRQGLSTWRVPGDIIRGTNGNGMSPNLGRSASTPRATRGTRPATTPA